MNQVLLTLLLMAWMPIAVLIGLRMDTSIKFARFLARVKASEIQHRNRFAARELPCPDLPLADQLRAAQADRQLARKDAEPSFHPSETTHR